MGGEGGLNLGDRDPFLRCLALLVKRGVDRLPGEADLLGLLAPEIAQAFGAEVGVLGLPRLESRDLAGAGRRPLPRRLEDLLAASGEGAEVVGVEALDLGEPVLDLAP